MPTDRITPLQQFFRRIKARAGGGATTDAELLRRFVHDRDEDAFSTLVHRHGPMVLSVCKRVLRDIHDAEDAFQATFLVLARKARAVGKPALLANWLHGVAQRTSLKAKTLRAKRSAKERSAKERNAVPRTTAPSQEIMWEEVREIIDEEIEQLPARCRLPFVYCYLEGKTNAEAAQIMDCPTGTILSRLAWARNRLKNRLTRRGISLSAALFTTMLTEVSASVVVPITLEIPTVRAALACLSVPALALTTGPITALAQGVLNMMWWSKVKVLAAMVLVVAVVGTGTGVSGYRWVTAAGEGGEVKGKVATPSSKNVEIPKPAPQKSDHELIQGTWKVEETMMVFAKPPPGAKFDRMVGPLKGRILNLFDKIIIGDAGLDIRIDKGKFDLEAVQLGAPLNAGYRLDEGKKWIDLTDVKTGVTLFGIYKFSEDSLEVGLVDGDRERPIGFESREGGPPMIHFKLKRVAPENVWGNEIEGVQTRLVAKKATWGADEVPSFVVSMWNHGEKPMSLERLPDGSVLWVDGKEFSPAVRDWPLPLELAKKFDTLVPGDKHQVWMPLVKASDWRNVSESPDGRMVVSDLSFSQGKHIIRLGMRAIRKAVGDDLEFMTVWTNPVEIDVLAPAKEQTKADEWGEAAYGVQARLNLKTTQWKVGESVTLAVDMRREKAAPDLPLDGQSEISFTDPFAADVQVDGKWYQMSGGFEYFKLIYKHLKPGGQGTTSRSFNPLAPWIESAIQGAKTENRKPDLKPGKHIIRVGVPITVSNGKKTSESFAISNPVEIEVLAPPAKEQTKADEWGEPALGLQGRLVAKKTQWRTDEIPEFVASLRNNGTQSFTISQPGDIYLQIDGHTFFGARLLDGDQPLQKTPDGKPFMGGVLERAKETIASGDYRGKWLAFRTNNLGPMPSDDEKSANKSYSGGFTVGKHLVRAKLGPFKRAGIEVDNIHFWTNAVEIEVLAETSYTWGEAVGGLQTRLVAKKKQWRADETPEFVVGLRNQGKKSWGIPRRQDCQLEVDGRVYSFDPEVDFSGRMPLFPADTLDPGDQRGGWRTLSTTGTLVETSLQTFERIEIKLGIGRHIARAKVTFFGDVTTAGERQRYYVWSSPVEIEIVASPTQEQTKAGE